MVNQSWSYFVCFCWVFLQLINLHQTGDGRLAKNILRTKTILKFHLYFDTDFHMCVCVCVCVSLCVATSIVLLLSSGIYIIIYLCENE